MSYRIMLMTLWAHLRGLYSRHRDASVAFAVRVVSAGLVFGLQIFLARKMPLEDYGVFVSISTWILVLAGFAVLGFSESALRFLPRYAVRERWGHARRFFRFGLATTISFVTVIACLVIMTAIQFWPDTPERTAILLIAIGLPLAVVNFFLDGVGRALGWFKLAIVPTYIVQPLLIVSIVWSVADRGATIDVTTASLVMISVAGALTLLKGVMIALRLAKVSKAGGPAADDTGRTSSPDWGRHWLRASLPLLVVYGLDDLLFHSDILILGLLATPQDVGVYVAAVRSLAIANFVHYAFMLVAAREFSIANSLHDRGLLQRQITETSRMTFMLTVPVVAITLMLGVPLLQLFGEEFVVAFPAMTVLGVGLIMRSCVGQAFDLLAVLGHAKVIAQISIACVLANVFLSLLLIPALGILGAALATAMAMGLRAGCLAFATWRLTGLSVVAIRLNPRSRAEALSGV